MWILTIASKHHTQRYTEKSGIYHFVPQNFQAVKVHENKKIPGSGCSPEWVLAVGGWWAPAGLASLLLGSIWIRPTGWDKTTLCANDSSEVMLLPLIWKELWWWSCGAATRQRCRPSVRGMPREQGSAFLSVSCCLHSQHTVFTSFIYCELRLPLWTLLITESTSKESYSASGCDRSWLARENWAATTWE